MGIRKKGYDALEGLVKLKPSPFWWINFTYNGKLIRESTKARDLDEAIKILQEVKRSLNSIDPRSKIIVDRYVKSLEKIEE
jgi:hypothetical protein